MSGPTFFDNLAFQIPNLVLAALMYTLMARLLLSFFFAPDSDRVFWRVFAQVTDWFVAAVRHITPKLVPERLVVAAAIAWVFLARLVLVVGVLFAGIV